MLKMFVKSKYKSAKKPFIVIISAVVLTAGLFLPSAAHANMAGDILNVLVNGLLNLGLRLLSGLFGLLVAAFIALVQFDFTEFWGVGESVDTAWRLLRDLANMLIIIGMLYIAFSTILKVGSAKWKNLAGGLLIMAVAVNFSKTIALIILDAGQMLMMTFVRAFQDIAVDNLTSGLMISKIYNQGNNFGWNLNLLTTWATQWLMIFMMIITVLVMLVIVILLIFRIVMIWFFVAVSPIAFAGYALPALKKHASQWWSFYIKLVFFGPMLAFFLWFSFLFMSKGIVPDTQFDAINQSVGMNYTDQQYFASQSTTPGNVIKFLLAVILLIVGTGMAIKAADFGGKAAGAVWGMGVGHVKRKIEKGEMPFKSLAKLTPFGLAGVAKNYIGRKLEGSKSEGARRLGIGLQMAGKGGLSWVRQHGGDKLVEGSQALLQNKTVAGILRATGQYKKAQKLAVGIEAAHEKLGSKNIIRMLFSQKGREDVKTEWDRLHAWDTTSVAAENKDIIRSMLRGRETSANTDRARMNKANEVQEEIAGVPYAQLIKEFMKMYTSSAGIEEMQGAVQELFGTVFADELFDEKYNPELAEKISAILESYDRFNIGTPNNFVNNNGIREEGLLMGSTKDADGNEITSGYRQLIQNQDGTWSGIIDDDTKEGKKINVIQDKFGSTFKGEEIFDTNRGGFATKLQGNGQALNVLYDLMRERTGESEAVAALLLNKTVDVAYSKQMYDYLNPVSVDKETGQRLMPKSYRSVEDRIVYIKDLLADPSKLKEATTTFNDTQRAALAPQLRAELAELTKMEENQQGAEEAIKLSREWGGRGEGKHISGIPGTTIQHLAASFGLLERLAKMTGVQIYRMPVSVLKRVSKEPLLLRMLENIEEKLKKDAKDGDPILVNPSSAFLRTSNKDKKSVFGEIAESIFQPSATSPYSDINLSKQARSELAYDDKTKQAQSYDGLDKNSAARRLVDEQSGKEGEKRSKEQIFQEFRTQESQKIEGGQASIYSKEEYQKNRTEAETLQKYREEHAPERKEETKSAVSRLKRSADAKKTDGFIAADLTGIPKFAGKAGVRLSGDNLKAYLEGLEKNYQEMLDQQFGDGPGSETAKAIQLAAFKKSIAGIESLKIINTGREGGSAKHIAAHENVHDIVEAGLLAFSAIWDQLGKTEAGLQTQDKIVEQVREQWNDPTMTRDDAMKEYFTEALTNQTRWARKDEKGNVLGAKLEDMFVGLNPEAVSGLEQAISGAFAGAKEKLEGVASGSLKTVLSSLDKKLAGAAPSAEGVKPEAPELSEEDLAEFLTALAGAGPEPEGAEGEKKKDPLREFVEDLREMYEDVLERQGEQFEELTDKSKDNMRKFEESFKGLNDSIDELKKTKIEAKLSDRDREETSEPIKKLTNKFIDNFHLLWSVMGDMRGGKEVREKMQVNIINKMSKREGKDAQTFRAKI